MITFSLYWISLFNVNCYRVVPNGPSQTANAAKVNPPFPNGVFNFGCMMYILSLNKVHLSLQVKIAQGTRDYISKIQVVVINIVSHVLNDRGKKY